MEIHTDRLVERDLWATLPQGCYLERVEQHGSRSRARKFRVNVSASPGADAHGLARVYARNSGHYGGLGHPEHDRAATWIEWGDWMVELFRRDPSARIASYDSPADFVAQTTAAAQHRPKRELAHEHAARWKEELAPYV